MSYSAVSDSSTSIEDPLVQSDGGGVRIPNEQSKRKRTIIAITLLLLIAAGVAIAAYVYTSNGSDDDPDTGKGKSEFLQAIKTENIMDHLKELDRIAQMNGGSRAVATGYNDSAAYVEAQLIQHCPGYTVERQYFVVPIYRELNPPKLSFRPTGATEDIELTEGLDFSGIRYGGNGEHDITAKIVVIPNGGCRSEDWDAARDAGEDVIALTEYDYGLPGGCHNFDKTLIADSIPSVRATIIHRNEQQKSASLPILRSFKLRWTEGDPVIQKPVVVSTYAAAQILAISDSVHLQTDTIVEMFNTFNIIADTNFKNARRSRTIIQGSHLDGVPEGPGVNDNGSGTCTNLELAIQFCKTVKNPKNHVRFAWWGAEEIGLLGSYHYVRELSPEEKAEIALAINYDMLASPNGHRGVHNGTETPAGTPEKTIVRSNHVRDVYLEWFESVDQPTISSPMLGGSDFFPFIEDGIPAGGIATGASGIVSMEHRERLGLIANAANDPCYHLECDSYLNIGVQMIEDISRAAAYVLETLAMDPNLFDDDEDGEDLQN